MIQGVILDVKTYQELLNKAEGNSFKIGITITGLNRNWEFLSLYDADKYGMVVSYGEEIPEKLKEALSITFKEELDALNQKIKEFTLLKGEIEVIQKLGKDDNRIS